MNVADRATVLAGDYAENCVELPVPVMLTSARLRLRTVAPLSTNGNSATGELDEERLRSLMV